MIRVKIEKNNNNSIKITATEGETQIHGFGTFLHDLKPEEIEADEFSKNVLLQAKSRTGLCGMELWTNRMSWAAPTNQIIMPIEEINNNNRENIQWLKDIKIVQFN